MTPASRIELFGARSAVLTVGPSGLIARTTLLPVAALSPPLERFRRQAISENGEIFLIAMSGWTII